MQHGRPACAHHCHQRRGRQHCYMALGQRACRAISIRLPAQHLRRQHQMRRITDQHHRAIRQVARLRRMVPLPPAIQPRGVKAAVYLGGLHRPENARPGCLKGLPDRTAAFGTRSMPGSTSHGLIQKEEFRILARRHQAAPAPIEGQRAGDPVAMPPPCRGKTPLRIMQTAAIAHEQTPRRIGHDLTRRPDSILSPHQATCPATQPDDQAHWKLYPPSQPVTSTTSPTKYSPGTDFAAIVRASSASVSTPPKVTSAVR